MILIKKTPIISLSIIWVCAIAIRMILFTGYMNGDMGNYIQEAHNFSAGHYSVPEIIKDKSLEELIPNPNFNWQNLRLGIIIPVGFLMHLFGVSDFSYAIFMFGCFTLSYTMVYLLGKELISESFGILSAFIFAFIPLEINLSTVLIPNIPAASFMALSCYLLLKGSRLEGGKRSFFIFFSGTVLSIAYYIWEFSLVLIPAVLIYLAINEGLNKFFFSKKFWVSFLSFTAGFVPLFIAGIMYFYSISGIFFFQQKLISVMGPKWIELHPIDAVNLGWDIYPKGIFYSSYFGIFYYLVFGGLLTVFLQYLFEKASRRKLMSSMLLPIVWLLWLGLYLQFGTSSLSHYQPIFKMRHYLAVLSIPASLLGAYCLLSSPFEGLLKKIKFGGKSGHYVRTGVVLFLLLSSVLCSAINFMGNGPFHRDMTYEHRIKAAVDSLPLNNPIYTDIWTKNGLDFVYGYARPVYAFNSIGNSNYFRPTELSEMKSGYVIINRVYLGSTHTMRTPVPEFVHHPPTGWELQAQVYGKTKSTSIDIYRILE